MASNMERILAQRIEALGHLRRSVTGEELFVGAVLVTPHDLAGVHGAAALAARARLCWPLALSFGALAAVRDDGAYFRAACQLMAEVEAWSGEGSALAAGIAELASAVAGREDEDWYPDTAGSGPVRTRVHRGPDGAPLYEFFLGAQPGLAVTAYACPAFVEAAVSLLEACECAYTRLLRGVGGGGSGVGGGIGVRADAAAATAIGSDSRPRDRPARRTSSVVGETASAATAIAGGGGGGGGPSASWPALPGAADALAKFDRRVKHHVIKALTLEYEAAAAARIAADFASVAAAVRASVAVAAGGTDG